MITGRPQANADDGVSFAQQLCRSLKIPPLSAYGITSQHLPGLVEKAAKISRMKNNSIALTAGEMKEVLEATV